MNTFWHGTTKENAVKILETGFNVGTWFATHLEDAIAYGGDYVFTIHLPTDRFSEDVDWQFHTLEHIPKSAIRKLEHWHKEVIFESRCPAIKGNKRCRAEIVERNAVYCDWCNSWLCDKPVQLGKPIEIPTGFPSGMNMYSFNIDECKKAFAFAKILANL